MHAPVQSPGSIPDVSIPEFSQLLKRWRMRRRISQLELSGEAGISQKHLSFLESGRSQPSRDMVIHLSEKLALPLRERNALLTAAGYAPFYLARPLDDPSLKQARAAIDLILRGHEPYPALAVDRHWHLVAANAAVVSLLGLVRDPALLAPPINVLRLTLHPDGLASAIVNLAQWREHLLDRMSHQVDLTMDPVLLALDRELRAYPAPEGSSTPSTGFNEVLVPMTLRTPMGDLSFLSTTTLFGTPIDVTLSEIAIESFFPADDATRDILRRMQAAAAG